MKLTIASHNAFALAAHLTAIAELFPEPGVTNPYQKYEILLRAEKEANRQMCKECNENVSDEESEKWSERFLKRLTKKLGIDKMPEGFFINGDPRGYTLKMKEGTFPKGLSSDWGGYGCLGASFE